MSGQFKNYQTLHKRLYRTGFRKKSVYYKFPCAGNIANLLLTVFTNWNEPIITIKDLVIYKIINNDFKVAVEFINILNDEGFIEVEPIILSRKEIMWSVKPGTYLSDLVDNEKLFILKNKKINLNQAIINIINKFDPPYTEEKYKKYVEETR